MPRLRQRPAPSVAKPIAEICNAAIDLLDRVDLTYEQVAARTGLRIGKQTLSRHLLGTVKFAPRPELIEALVNVVAAELSIEHQRLYDEHPVLRQHVNPSRAPLAQPDTEPPPTLVVDLDEDMIAGWLWSEIIEGREHLAAVAMEGLRLDICDAGRIIRLIIKRDLGAAGALVRAIGEVYGPDRADALLTSPFVDPAEQQAVQDFDVSGYRRRNRPLWDVHDLARMHVSESDGAEFVGRRLGALVERGDSSQACRELQELAARGDRGHTAVCAAVGMGASNVIVVLNELAGGCDSAPGRDGADALSTIVSALLADARASNRTEFRDQILRGLDLPTFKVLLGELSNRLLLTRTPAGSANLSDLLAMVSDASLGHALAAAGSGYSCDYVAGALLAEGRTRLRQISGDGHAIGEFFRIAFEQCLENPSSETRTVPRELAAYLLVETDEFIYHVAKSWRPDCRERLVLELAELWPQSARAAAPLAALIVYVGEGVRISLTEMIFAVCGSDKPNTAPIRAVQVWVGVIAGSPEIAESLVPVVSVHKTMLELGVVSADHSDDVVRRWSAPWNAAMSLLQAGDFGAAAEQLRHLPNDFRFNTLRYQHDAYRSAATADQPAAAPTNSSTPSNSPQPNWGQVLRKFAADTGDAPRKGGLIGHMRNRKRPPKP